MSAVCRRYLREFRPALKLLAKLKTLAHEVGRVHQEEGHVYRDSDASAMRCAPTSGPAGSTRR